MCPQAGTSLRPGSSITGSCFSLLLFFVIFLLYSVPPHRERGHPAVHVTLRVPSARLSSQFGRARAARLLSARVLAFLRAERGAIPESQLRESSCAFCSIFCCIVYLLTSTGRSVCSRTCCSLLVYSFLLSRRMT